MVPKAKLPKELLQKIEDEKKQFAKKHRFIHVVHRDLLDGGKGKPEALNCG